MNVTKIQNEKPIGFIDHTRYAWDFYRANFHRESRAYFGGWMKWSTAWQATSHLGDLARAAKQARQEKPVT